MSDNATPNINTVEKRASELQVGDQIMLAKGWCLITHILDMQDHDWQCIDLHNGDQIFFRPGSATARLKYEVIPGPDLTQTEGGAA